MESFLEQCVLDSSMGYTGDLPRSVDSDPRQGHRHRSQRDQDNCYHITVGEKKIVASSRRGSDIARMLETYVRIIARHKFACKRLSCRLIDLLHDLPFRESFLPRDHIYSLHAIVLDGDLIPVNYGSSDNQFVDGFCTVLAKSGSLGLCALACMARALQTDVAAKLPIVRVEVLCQTLGKVGSIKGNGAGTICARCNAYVSAVDAQDHLICLGQECSQFPGSHLVLRKDPKNQKSTLRLASKATHCLGLRVKHLKHGSGGAEIDVRVLNLSRIYLYVPLHSLIRFSSHLEKNTGEICGRALARSALYKLYHERPCVY